MLVTTRILWVLALVIALLIALVTCSGLPGQNQGLIFPPNCTAFFIPVTVQATNLFTPVTFTAVGPIFNVTVNSTFNIGGTFCEPGNNSSTRAGTLQLLVHGVTYDRTYWSGHGYQDPTYSWIDYASSQGYPTLSIDRLGNGLSDHPNPETIVQTPVQVEIIQSLILAARAGQLPGPMDGKVFSKIIYAGHSYGSILGNSHNAKYPSEIDATILTGFSTVVNIQFILTNFLPFFVPAALEDPLKFGTLDYNYLKANNSTAIQRCFYYPGGFDPSLFTLDFNIRGTAAYGEIASGELGVVVATQHRNPVFIATGQHDAIFCAGKIENGQENDCGTTTISSTKNLYPSVGSEDFDWVAPQNSGHCWQLHHDAFVTFGTIHDWLALKGF